MHLWRIGWTKWNHGYARRWIPSPFLGPAPPARCQRALSTTQKATAHPNPPACIPILAIQVQKQMKIAPFARLKIAAQLGSAPGTQQQQIPIEEYSLFAQPLALWVAQLYAVQLGVFSVVNTDNPTQ